MEILFELIGEFLLQAVAEALFELGLHSFMEPFRHTPNPWFAGVGYALIGSLVGAASLFAFPHLLVTARFRWANLILSPIASGVLMSLVGAWRQRRGHAVLRIDRFAYGFAFALGLALERFFFAK
jgi:hypothetical protein